MEGLMNGKHSSAWGIEETIGTTPMEEQGAGLLKAISILGEYIKGCGLIWGLIQWEYKLRIKSKLRKTLLCITCFLSL